MSLKNMEFVSIDTATTGYNIHEDKLVELAAVKYKNGIRGEYKVWRVNPGKRIPPDASAYHEIRDKDVNNCPSIEAVETEIKAFIGDRPIVFHNLISGEPLDHAVLPFLHKNKWLCNGRFSKHIWNQTEVKNDFELHNYDIWTLTYWNNGSKIDLCGMEKEKFRPLATALATGFVFKKCLGEYLEFNEDATLDELSEFIQSPFELKIWPFGRFRDTKIADIQDHDLGVLLKESRVQENFDADLKNTLEKEVDRRLKLRNNSIRKI